MKPTRARFIVLAGLCSAAALAYFVRNGVAPAESTIRADLGLTKEQSGLMMSAFFWPYALCQIPAAMLAQRLGARWALVLYAVMWSLATAGLAMGELGWMTASRAFMGVAQAGLVPVGVMAMSRWFPKTTQASAAGAFSGFMSVGSIVAAPLTAWFVMNAGWRWMFVLNAVPGVLWAAWFAWWYRNQPSEHQSVNAAEREWIEKDAVTALNSESSHSGECAYTSRLVRQNEGLREGNNSSNALAIPWRSLASSPSLWLLCTQQFFRAAGYIFFASWFATYLQEARGMTLAKSAWLTTLPLLADVAGGFSGGLISDALMRWTGRPRLARQGMAMTMLMLCAALIFSAWFVAQPVLAVIIISAGMYCAGAVNPCYSATLMAYGGPHAGTVSAITNMCGNFGAASFPIAVPWLIAHAGGWDAVLVGFGTIYVVAAMLWVRVRT